MPIQANLENILSKPKEIGQICAFARDYDPFAKNGFASMIPAGPALNPLKSKYYDQYGFKVAPVFLSPDGKIEIYRKGEISGHGKVDLPQEFIEETIKLAQNYSLKNWGTQLLIDLEHQKFPGYDKYTENMIQIWNNTKWDFVDAWLEETIAIDRKTYIDRIFTQLNLSRPSQKQETNIVLLKKDVAKNLNLIKSSPAN